MDEKLTKLCSITSNRTGYKLKNIVEFVQGLMGKDMSIEQIIIELKVLK